MAETGSSNGTIKLLEDLLRILKEEKLFDARCDQSVINFRHPKDLKNIISLTLKEDGASSEEIDIIVRQIIKYSVKTFSPNFHNQLFAGVDEYGMVGSWLTEIFNTGQYTFEVAPVFTLMEHEVLEECLKLVGYPSIPEANGILCPGGSLSNMYAIVMARYKILPEIKRMGCSGFPPLACFSSEEGHYSILKAVHWLGIGTEHVHKIKSDQLGKMLPDDLKRAINEARANGELPFFVNATCGTTVLGAFDPLPEIARICEEESLWMHVDACLGGTLLLSEKYRERLRGIELSHSVAWNPHKMLGAPLQCSIFLAKGKEALHKTNCAGAKYLFQQDKFYDVSWDTGDKSVQCGRKVDAMKFWLMWKARGTSGLRKSVDIAMSEAEYFFDRIKLLDGYRLVLPSYECCNICFWYVPPSMRGQEETDDWWQKLYKVTTLIKERMILDGTLMISYMPLASKNLGNFFRMVVTCQPPPTHASMDYVIDLIEKYGANL
ncbi:cysteine sulfinic acid decarboxylase isoform X2 [Vespa velutina]|nr:cysteine sulfinic acid decarboxylase isoform X2 [Vespa velutina]XP_047366961.1 cysteine sulfinic acid decarboxylase isoform X2 [Vespa velutina]XP_047366962.1 cysteine sulfinic acid decarboxylase isoform X2 [Vespa velutina]